MSTDDYCRNDTCRGGNATDGALDNILMLCELVCLEARESIEEGIHNSACNGQSCSKFLVCLIFKVENMGPHLFQL